MKIAYGPWLKAITITERLKQSIRKNKWDSQPNNSHTNFATPTKITKNQGTTETEQGRKGDLGNEDGSSRHLSDPGMDSTTGAMGKLQKVVGTQLMLRDTAYMEPIGRGSENEKVAGKDTEHWDMGNRAKAMGGKREEREIIVQDGNAEKTNPSIQAMWEFLRGE